MIVSLLMLQAISFQYTQPSNHSSTECRTNYGAKLNFIGIKKIEGVLNIFLKGRQINFFKLLYKKKKISGQGGPGTTLALRWRHP